MVAIVISLLLLLAAYIDVKQQIIPVFIPLIIVLAACFESKFLLLSSIISGIFSALLLLVPTVIKPNCFGGGDIKLIAALGFYLGFMSTIIALVFSLLLLMLFARLTSVRHKRLPFAPFIFITFVPTIFMLAR